MKYFKPTSILYSFGVNSWKPVTLGDFFRKENVYFIPVNAIFLLLPPENQFLQTFRTITAHNNKEFTMKH